MKDRFGAISKVIVIILIAMIICVILYYWHIASGGKL